MTDGRDSSAAPAPRRRRPRLWLLLGLLVVALVAGTVLVVEQVRSPPATPAPAAQPVTAPTSPSAAPTPTPSATPTPTPSSSAPVEPAFDRSRFSLDDPASPWVVVNKARPVSPVDHAPADLVPVGGGYELRAEAAGAMQAMLAGAAAEGLTITVQSAYRSYDYQVGVFRAQVARFGEAQAEIQVARPGHSEHQTGLAADVGGGGCDIDRCFGAIDEGRWVAAHAAEYGWVVRYPEGKTEVTGFRYEPWHVRYVGVELATELQRTGTATLEEFFGLPAAPDYPG
ncbi:M15 family metallopeptidase [Modestobacter sp. VKM Ac-2986]|uniref:M15 family metallopeptidase n=1 Tax=Modestobacter sp. VKM Ac-2986 TaxID=3004140 RepID=UPI0022AB990D|nr:M15 family metallopeptidase [Modestobacter sp. VKM Ac-2986]MCZ2830315.1 M15 family metallopeptidase [Modestobacter sp. VKM Ac-2986]